MQDTPRGPRRRHSAEFKAAVLAACTHPGASVASVALAHGVNANLVHRWRRGAADRGHGRRGKGELAEFAIVRTPIQSLGHPSEQSEHHQINHGRVKPMVK